MQEIANISLKKNVHFQQNVADFDKEIFLVTHTKTKPA